MGTRGAPCLRASAPGTWLAPVLLAGVLAAGCAETAATGHGGASPRPQAHRSSASPSPRVTSPAGLCAGIVAYWSRKVLADDTYGDYQSMGLSNGQYEILRRTVAAARPVRQRQGAAAANDLIGRQAGEACAERYRDGALGKGPWQ